MQLKIALSLVLVLALSSCSSMRQVSGIDKLKPCTFDQGPNDGYCGTLKVFENRQIRSGRQIALKIVVLPALKQDAAPDPLFILAGGPGQGAAELAKQLHEPFRRIESGHDIVLVDQRGTGKSNPLDCKPSDDVEEDDDESPDGFVRLMHTCLDSFKDKADLTKYTTEIAMDDLDDVRHYLGYSKIDLYGGSYGTRAAIVYARRHADHTRAVVLDGVAPTDMRLPLYMARDGQRSLDLLIHDCEQDAGCNKRFPNLRSRLDALLARLTAHPQHIKYTDPRTGLEKEMDLRRLTLTSIIFASLYSPTTAATIPLLIEEAEKGNFNGFLALRSGTGAIAENMAQGMHFSVVCAEDAPRIERGSIEKESANTFLGSEMADLRMKPCDFWPREAMDPSYYTNAPSDVPALILSGQLDPITPPTWGEQVASAWKNSRHIVVPATGHGTAGSGCVMKLIAQFLNDGTAAKLDASCVATLKRPPFFLGPSGPDAMGGAGK